MFWKIIIEDFVTFEQSVELKELGFDWETDYMIVVLSDNSQRIVSKIDFRGACLNRILDEYYYAPTLAQVQKWLREVKGLDITINHVYYRLDTGDKVTYGLHIGDQSTFKTEFYRNYDTYCEALTIGIDNALKILKNKIL